MDAGQEEEFRRFVEARWHSLVRTAYLLTGDRHRAEDLVQQVLVKVHRRWSHVGRDGSPYAYTRAALANESASWWRRKRVPESLGEVPVAADRDPGDAYAAYDARDEVARAVLGPATADARRGGAAVLRRPVRGGHRRRPRDVGRVREEPGVARPRPAAHDPHRDQRGPREEPVMSLESQLREALTARADELHAHRRRRPVAAGQRRRPHQPPAPAGRGRCAGLAAAAVLALVLPGVVDGGRDRTSPPTTTVVPGPDSPRLALDRHVAHPRQPGRRHVLRRGGEGRPHASTGFSSPATCPAPASWSPGPHPRPSTRARARSP